MIKPCIKISEFYNELLSYYHEFFRLYSIAGMVGNQAESGDSRRKALAVAKKFFKLIQENIELQQELRDRAIRKRILEINQSQISMLESQVKAGMAEAWRLDVEVKNGVVRFKKLNGEFNCDAVGQAIQYILSAKHSPVEALDLSDQDLSEDMIYWLSEGLTHPNNGVAHLILSNNELGQSTNLLAKVLQNHNNKLRHLELFDCMLNTGQLEDIFGALKSKNCRLQSLNLAYNLYAENDLYPELVKLICDALSHPTCTLKYLDFSQNNLYFSLDVFLQHLIQFHSLEYFDLSGTNFGDEHAEIFAHCYNPSMNLKTLILSNNNDLTENGREVILQALKKHNSSLKVVF